MSIAEAGLDIFLGVSAHHAAVGLPVGKGLAVAMLVGLVDPTALFQDSPASVGVVAGGEAFEDDGENEDDGEGHRE